MGDSADGPGAGANNGADAPADGSFAAKHPDRGTVPILVGPSTADQKNAVRADLTPIACWRLDDIRFEVTDGKTGKILTIFVREKKLVRSSVPK